MTIGAHMPEETTDAPNLPSSSPEEAHIPSADVPDDPAASASAEIFAAMDGSTLADVEAGEAPEAADGEHDEGDAPAE
ncbi:MAG TPA: hypothetical protein VIJ51_17875 [Solirubrobacteraceae bacterium]